MVWCELQSPGKGQGKMARCCQHGNKPSSCVNSRVAFNLLSD
jgi:hypothetical protein